jgi:hypothetical protein
MRIDTSGNVGIGTSTPTAKLDVRGATYISSTLNVGGPSAQIGPDSTHSGPNLYFVNTSGQNGAGPSIVALNNNSTGAQKTAAYINPGLVDATAGAERGLIDFSVLDGTNAVNRIVAFSVNAGGTGANIGPSDNNYWSLGLSSYRFSATYSVNGDFSGDVQISNKLTVSTNTSGDAVRITQTGSGNALVVEDETNPDSTPFVINTVGRVLVSATAQQAVGGFNPFIQNHNTNGTGQFQWSSDSGAAKLWFAKSRGASPGTQGIVSSGDQIARIAAYGSDGTQFIQAAEIRVDVDGTPGTNDMPGRIVFSTTADNASSITERMRIDNAGNVGIGTSAPSALLNVVANTATDALRITQTGAGNALVVEDSANPDSTPFVVDTDGSAILGATARFTTATTGSAKLQLITGSATISRFLNDANQQRLEFVKSRSTTIGSAATIVQSGDVLGEINFQGADGTAFVQAASISATVDGTPGTNDMPGRLVFNTTADGASSPTERMRIDNAGNVGIGTASPSALLNVVANTSTDALRITQTGAGNSLVVEDSANPDSTPFVVDTSGNVIVGTTAVVSATNPINGLASNFAFEVVGTGASGGAAFIRSDTSSAPQPTIFAKSRGTPSSPTVVSNGDAICLLAFQAYDGAQYRSAAFIGATVDATPGSGNMPGRLIFSTTADGAAAPTERMRIDNAGNVLIGTTTAGASKLVVNDSSIQINTAKTPSSATATGTTGQVCWDTSYIYVCTATNTWKRVAIATW